MLIMMTAKEAMALQGEDAKVLVAVRNLEDESSNFTQFESKKFVDCFDMIKNAKTIYHSIDDLISKLSVFSEIQENLMNINNVGYQGTILLQSNITDS